MPASQTALRADPATAVDIDMPRPYAFAPAPGRRWTASVDLAEVNIRALTALWESRRPSRHGLPALAQFDPLALQPWTEHLIVLEAEPLVFGGRSYLYRTVGAAAAGVEGGNFQGLFLSDALSPAQSIPRIRLYDLAMDARASMRVRQEIALERAGKRVGRARWDALALPLARDGRRPDHLMMLAYVEALG
ncbi:hypothetical protein T8K17_09965 [Thalassobaculum sp. OXR-137]|uniref:hypothetical protein n=1 Tax=Thalassobaculum sp. OXR-137 TaxID=3100173 RepID=UPI002AC9B48B|nr:hypothetical protein [Thalassobaculum sp. OXR-137]WPZ36460.1 hypothetical protein T8K17_09965 [Thalassobaculum sp. OXR-137]